MFSMVMKKLSEYYKLIVSKMKHFFYWQKEHPRFKYWLCLVIMLIMTFGFGEDNIYQMIKKQARLMRLDNEIENFNEQFKKDSIRLVEIENDKDRLEHKARLRFMMKAPDEQVYVIADPEDSVQDTTFATEQ